MADPVTVNGGDLKPCPFCRSLSPQETGDNGGFFIVACMNCQARGPARTRKADAASDWNHRASQGEGEALERAYEWIKAAPHRDECFQNDPNPDACKCICGKDRMLEYLADPTTLPALTSPLQARKGYVPVEDFALAIGFIIAFAQSKGESDNEHIAERAEPLLAKWTKDRLDALASEPVGSGEETAQAVAHRIVVAHFDWNASADHELVVDIAKRLTEWRPTVSQTQPVQSVSGDEWKTLQAVSLIEDALKIEMLPGVRARLVEALDLLPTPPADGGGK